MHQYKCGLVDRTSRTHSFVGEKFTELNMKILPKAITNQRSKCILVKYTTSKIKENLCGFWFDNKFYTYYQKHIPSKTK